MSDAFTVLAGSIANALSPLPKEINHNSPTKSVTLQIHGATPRSCAFKRGRISGAESDYRESIEKARLKQNKASTLV